MRTLYDQVESATAKAMEEAVDTRTFGQLLVWSAENIAALTRIGADIADLTLRNLRIAGRADVTRLARQLGRTEDKLERVLQEVEAVRDELRRRAPNASDGRDPVAPRAGAANREK